MSIATKGDEDGFERESNAPEEAAHRCPRGFRLVSAKLADRTVTQAIYMTGYGTVASRVRQPEVGLATYSQMQDRVQAIRPCDSQAAGSSVNSAWRALSVIPARASAELRA